jgi:DNA polymerase
MGPKYKIPAFIDYESFWDVGYSLRQQKLSMTDYIHDPRFEIHGASVAIADSEPTWLRGRELKDWVRQRASEGNLFVGHHTLFDGYISTYWAGQSFADYFCTMGMIEALYQGAVGRGLDEAMTTLLRWESGKTDILARTKGKHWDEFTDDERNDMIVYASKDLKGTQALFYQMASYLPECEWETMSNTLKMCCRPLLRFDSELLGTALQEAQDDREEEIMDALRLFDCTEKDLSGNNTFIALLDSINFNVPMKQSPSDPNKMIPALAKTDQGFHDMLESEDPRVAALAKGRLAVKSTQGITRAQRFIDLDNTVGVLPAAYNYYRAHTGRPTGANKINVANLRRGSNLRKSIIAPPDKFLGVADSSQIECRSDGYLAGQNDLMDLFREKRDPYNDMASTIFGRPIDRKREDENGNYPDFLEGFIGKTAVLGLGYQMGGPKFALTVKTNAKVQLGLDYEISLDEAYRIVQLYRQKNYKIVEFWNAAERMLRAMAFGEKPYDYEYADGILHVDTRNRRIWFPNETCLYYPFLSVEDGNFTYMNKMGPKYVSKYIYGGKLVENIVQKFARDIVSWQMNNIARELPCVLQTYDEVVALINEQHPDIELQWMLDEMRRTPDWAKSLPLDAEGGYAKEYSK